MSNQTMCTSNTDRISSDLEERTAFLQCCCDLQVLGSGIGTIAIPLELIGSVDAVRQALASNDPCAIIQVLHKLDHAGPGGPVAYSALMCAAGLNPYLHRGAFFSSQCDVRSHNIPLPPLNPGWEGDPGVDYCSYLHHTGCTIDFFGCSGKIVVTTEQYAELAVYSLHRNFTPNMFKILEADVLARTVGYSSVQEVALYYLFEESEKSEANWLAYANGLAWGHL